MSDMLKQAIIDATMLKEVATKNAESVILEKYSDKIKEAVEQMLEQDDEEIPEEDELKDNELPEEDVEDIINEPVDNKDEASIVATIPFAATDGMKVCQCPDEEEEIEIDFDELEQNIEDSEQPEKTQEELANDVAIEPEEQMQDVPEDEEEFDIDDEKLKTIMEEMEVDMEPVPSGWRGTPQAEKEENMMMALAQEQDTKIKKENEALRKNMEVLQKENKNMKEKTDKLLAENNKYIQLLSKLKDNMKQLIVTNAKYLYMNQALNSSSFNERQKNKIVESIQKTNSVEESKMVYESFLSTMGTITKKRLPESLSEAISKPSTMLLESKMKYKGDNDDTSNRMKILAGISKK